MAVGKVEKNGWILEAVEGSDVRLRDREAPRTPPLLLASATRSWAPSLSQGGGGGSGGGADLGIDIENLVLHI